MKHDTLGLYFPILDVDFVTAENNRYVFADTDQISVPVGYIFIRHSGCDIEHDYSTLSLNIIAIAQTSELFLTGRIPDVETDRSTIGVEDERMHLYTQSGDVLLFEFTGKMPFNEGGLTGTTVADEHALEGGHIGFVCHFYYC